MQFIMVCLTVTDLNLYITIKWYRLKQFSFYALNKNGYSPMWCLIIVYECGYSFMLWFWRGLDKKNELLAMNTFFVCIFMQRNFRLDDENARYQETWPSKINCLFSGKEHIDKRTAHIHLTKNNFSGVIVNVFNQNADRHLMLQNVFSDTKLWSNDFESSL